MSDDRPPRYVEQQADGTEKVVYRASSLGQCERSLVATALDYARRPHPQWFQEVLDEGTAAEPLIRAKFAESQGELDHEGWQDQYEGELEIGTIDGRLVVVRYHADDVLLDDDDPPTAVLREYKKFRDSTWPKFQRQGVECNPNYPMQVAVMMHHLKRSGYEVCCQFIGGHWDGSAITEVEHKTLADPPVPLAGILKRVARIERLINSGAAPDEVACQSQFPCGHWYLHDDQLGGAVAGAEVSVGDAREVVELIGDEQLGALKHWQWTDEQVRYYKGKVDEFERQKKQAAERLSEYVPAGARCTGVIDGVEVALTRHRQEVPERTQTVRAHVKDYFQAPRAAKQKDESSE